MSVSIFGRLVLISKAFWLTKKWKCILPHLEFLNFFRQHLIVHVLLLLLGVEEDCKEN
jgi:hypothetical protein